MRYLKHLFPLCVLIGGVYGCSKSRIVQSPTVKTYAYVSGYSTVYTCGVNQETGQFESCQDSGFNQFAFAQGITVTYPTAAIATVGLKTYAYIANNSDGNIYQCLIDPTTGLFTGCELSGAGVLTGAVGIGINTASNGNPYIYVLSNSGSSVSQCSINETTGQLACTTFSNTFSGDAPSIVFNTIGGNTYVYLSTDDTFIQRCNVNFDGTFSNCQEQTISGLTEEYGIAFASIGNQVNAYITDYDTSIVLQCVVSVIDGSLYNCSPALANYESPSIATSFLNGQWFIYSSLYDNDVTSVIKCSINSTTAILENCTDSGVGAVFFSKEDQLPMIFANFTY